MFTIQQETSSGQVVTVNVNERQNVLLDMAFSVIVCIITRVSVTWRYNDQL